MPEFPSFPTPEVPVPPPVPEVEHATQKERVLRREILELLQHASTLDLDPVNSQTAYFGNVSQEKEYELPEEFSDLVEDYPGEFYIVYYTDRRNEAYKVDNGVFVGLATTLTHQHHQGKQREIEVSARNTSTEKFNLAIGFRVSERVYNEVGDHTATHDDRILHDPHGEQEMEYLIKEDGKKELLSTMVMRVDVDDATNLRVQRGFKETAATEHFPASLTYDEIRTVEGVPQAMISVRARGGKENANAETITVEVGTGRPSEALIIFQDPTQKIRILVHRGYETAFDLLNQNILLRPILQPDPSMSREELFEHIQALTDDLKANWQNEYVLTSKPEDSPVTPH